MHEIMHLPVGEVGEVKLGRQRSPDHAQGPNMVPYLRVANVCDGYIDYSDVLTMNFTPEEQRIFSLRKGDVLLNEGQSLELVGRSAIYDGPDGMCFQNHLIRFRSTRVLPHYAQAVFKYWLDTGRFAKVATQTTSIASLGADRLAKMPFPLVPMAEQHQIVEILDAIDRQTYVVSRVQSKLRTLHKGTIHDILSSLAEEEQKKRSITYCRDILSFTGGLPQAEAIIGPSGNVPIYGSSGLAGYGSRALSPGETIVIGRVGEGGVGSVRYVAEPAWITDNALWAIRIAGDVLAEFASIYLDWLDLRQFRSQTGQPLITQKAIDNLIIVKPALSEQRRVVEIHRKARTAVEQGLTELAKLRALKRGLMSDLLTGKVRVPMGV